MTPVRKRLPLAAMIAVGLALVIASAASAAALPPQGLYEECAPASADHCTGELSQMGQAGFKLALNYTGWQGSASDLQAYAASAQANGVQVIWPLDGIAWRARSGLRAAYPALASGCNCTGEDAFLQYAVNLVKSLPATWGYYIGDEVDPSQAASVAALAAELRALDPSHPLLYVGKAYPDLTGNLRPFAAAVDYIGADPYPVGTQADLSFVGDTAAAVAQLAAGAGRKPVMVLQAFNWAQYPAEMTTVNPHFPSESEFQTMRDQALAANPAMLLWYNLHDIQRSDDSAGHWRDLVQAAFAPPPASTLAAPAGPPAGGSGTLAVAASVPHRSRAKARASSAHRKARRAHHAPARRAARARRARHA